MSKPKFGAEIYLDSDNYLQVVNHWKQKNQTVVFTNGCFDILHAGHVDYLEEASRLGDKLVIGLNDDASVTILKGKSRPINKVADRAKLLAALFMVDMIIIFGAETPIQLIEEIDPDYLVKGGDYEIDEIVGADLVKSRGKKVVIMPEKKGYSSTKIIESLS